MTLTDEELDALAERLCEKHWAGRTARAWREVALEAARWAEEREGEVVWETDFDDEWSIIPGGLHDAIDFEEAGYAVRAIRVVATTTKGVG